MQALIVSQLSEQGASSKAQRWGTHLAGERLRGMGKRDVAKRRDPFVQIVKHEITDIPTCQNIVTHIKTDQWRAGIHTNMFIHMHLCA